MMQSIEIGDKVRHKTNNFYNFLEMEVTEIEESKIYCNYYDNKEKIYKTSPAFNVNELELIKKVEGGFTS